MSAYSAHIIERGSHSECLPLCLTQSYKRSTIRQKEDSDVDLIVEFLRPISILTLLEELLKSKVDLIHGPLRETDMIHVGREVVLYAA